MANNLFQQIRQVVKNIPKGKVMTYGQVAKAVNSTDARKVGWALHGNQDKNIPCHRVVKKDGLLAKNFSLGGWDEQQRMLQVEGIVFTTKHQVDIQKHQVVS